MVTGRVCGKIDFSSSFRTDSSFESRALQNLSLEITSDRFTSNRLIGFRGNFGKTLPRSIQTLWTHLFKYSETIFESVLTRPSFKNTQMYNKYRNLTTLVLMRRQEREADWKRNFSDRLLFALWRREKKKKKKKKKQSSRRAALSKSFRLRLEFVQRPERFAFHRGQYISRIGLSRRRTEITVESVSRRYTLVSCGGPLAVARHGVPSTRVALPPRLLTGMCVSTRCAVV